jgi:hypothetical protein
VTSRQPIVRPMCDYCSHGYTCKYINTIKRMAEKMIGSSSEVGDVNPTLGCIHFEHIKKGV